MVQSLTKYNLFPQATPQLRNKARPASRKVRPTSVVGIGVTNLSHDHIPRFIESHSFRRDSKDSTTTEKPDEQYDSITELPSTSQQLQHLVKNRPKKAKTRAPTRGLLAEQASLSIGEGLEAFFRPGSTTPSTLTPVVSPTSEDTSFLSFVDSPTLSRGDENGRFSNVTSGETTPIMDERKIKLSRQSPLLKTSINWTPRSRSTDNIEGTSPNIGRKSPMVKYETMDEPHSFISLDGRKLSPCEDALSELAKINNGICKTPSKPRPWSVVGNELKQTCDSTHTTPDELDSGTPVKPHLFCVVL